MLRLVSRAVGSVYRLIEELVREWQKDRVGGLAAEISFFALLSLIPSVLALTGVLGSADALFGTGFAADAEEWIVEQLRVVFGNDTGVDGEVSSLFQQNSASAVTIGTFVAVYAASRGMRAMISALDVAYAGEYRRGWISTRLVGVSLTILTFLMIVIVLAMVVIGPLFGRGEELSSELGLGSGFETFWAWFRWPTVLAVLILWATMVYHIAPNHWSPWRYELPGAALFAATAGLFTAAFSIYLNRFAANSNAFFGLLGSVLSVMLWIYLLSIGLLLGAELNSILAMRSGVGRSEKRPEPFRTGFGKARAWLRDRRAGHAPVSPAREEIVTSE